MSSRSVRKRRHREDFAEYSAARQQFKGIASQWKKFGFPNETAFIKALLEHARMKNAEGIPATEHSHVDDHEHGEGCTHHHDDRGTHGHIDTDLLEHQTSQLDMWNEVNDDQHENHDAAEEAEQQKLREGIESSLADDRAALDYLPDPNE